MADQTMPYVPMRRGVEFLGVRTEDGSTVARFLCDCAAVLDAVLDVVLDGLDTTAASSHEIAFTCDCTATHWVTIHITPPADMP